VKIILNYQDNYRQKLLKFQSLLQKYAKQPLQEKDKIDPQIEVAFSDAIIALEQIPLSQARFGRSLLLFNLIEVIKDTDLIYKYSLQLEQIIIDDFRLSIDNLTMFQAIFNGIKA